ncbi:uncharacterized protein LOC128205462 [Mya arenaria]|uniref:uncharacterized protein LOC128205462 n=1 Tax=Mya arenaria TaxID=6604 RepID=UPI0022E63791|nr:uncharacterized protein LOC128205462 [Mya arenaria]
MKQDMSKELVIRANEFLNKHFKTSYETSDFVHAVQIQHVESHLQNPMFALQLLCVYHNKRSENKTYPTNEAMGSTEYKTESDYHKQKSMNLGKTRSHLYANMIELMLRSAEKKDKPLVQGLSELYKNNGQTHALPECFDERNYTCCGLAKLLHDIGKLAASSLLGDNRSLIEEHQIRKLRKEETTVLLKSGLLSNTSLKTISEERSLYTFLHQTYKEMLACVFLSSQDFDSDVWKKFINKFETVMSPDMLSFLCVMNYEQGCKCLDIFNEKERLFYRDSMFYISDLIDYQSTITLAHKECSDNGVKTPRISLKHILLEQDSGIGPYHALLKASGIKLETIVIRKCTFTTAINPNLFSASLAYLLVERTTFHDDHIDFSICTHLAILIIQECHLASITINPSYLEVLLLSIGSEVRQELPHINVSFVGGSHFSNSLQKLCLEHVSMDGHIDLANCRKLQSLFINYTTSEGLTGICDVCNMQCCDALQEIHLHTLIFPSDTHLDLSGLRHISKITIQNCHLTNITINPSYLEVLLLSIGSEVRQELPHMKVTFVGGSQFSNTLQELCLMHVAMYVSLDLANCQKLHKLNIENTTSEGLTGIFDVCNMQCCSALQELRLDALTFLSDTHLDLSGLRHISKITIQNCHLANITINPSCLEKLWLYMRSEMRQELPHMKVSFLGGSHFSNSLQILCLMHVSMDGHIDLANCRKLQSLFINNTTSEVLTGICDVCNMQCCSALQELRLETLKFPADTHLDLSGLRHISQIIIDDCHLANITINPSCLDILWLYMSLEWRQELPHMKVSFVGGSQFPNSLHKLCLMHVAMYVPLDLVNCQELHTLIIDNTTSEGLTGIFDVCNMQCCSALQELCLTTLKFPADTHLDLSGLRHISKIRIQNCHLANITVNPSCLEVLWLYMRSEWRQELPHMKVSFVGGSHFSNSLHELCLMQVSMDGHIDLANCRKLHKLIIDNTTSEGLTGLCDVYNMHCCDALHELRLEALKFPADTHLDLSGLRHISKIIIDDCHLDNITINPSCLEELLLKMSSELMQELPRMEVSFVDGSQFPNSLQKLCLMHVAMDVPLDLVNCQELHTLIIDNTTSEGLTGIFDVCNMQCCSALQELGLTTLKFPADTHLDLSGLRHISKITIQNCHLDNITITPSCLEKLWLYMRSEWMQELPRMKVSFVSGSQFSNSLHKLCLMHVTMDVPLDLVNCQELHTLIIDNTTSEVLTGIFDVCNMQCCSALQELRLDALTFLSDTHFDLSGLRHISKIRIQNCHLAKITLNPSQWFQIPLQISYNVHVAITPSPLG